MRAALRFRNPRHLLGWVVAGSALVVPPATLGLLHLFPHYDVVFESVDFHLAVVGGISACACGVALSAGLAARRTVRGRWWCCRPGAWAWACSCWRTGSRRPAP